MPRPPSRYEPLAVGAAEALVAWPLWLGALAALRLWLPSGAAADVLSLAVPGGALAAAVLGAVGARCRLLAVRPVTADETHVRLLSVVGVTAVLVAVVLRADRIALDGWLGPAAPALVGLAALAFVAAAASLWVTARRVRRQPSGVITEREDGSIALCVDEPAGPRLLRFDVMPEGCSAGTELTLAGVREQAAGGAPYRAGLPIYHADGAWTGPADALARGLAHRALGWTLGAALTLAVGVVLLG